MIIKCHQMEFPQSWIIQSVNKLCWGEVMWFLEAHGHSPPGNRIRKVGGHSHRGLCVNVPSQREHSHAEPLVIWLQIPVCCDLRMLVNCRRCPDSHQPSLCCFSGAHCPESWAATGEGGQAPGERTGQESGRTMTSLELPLHLHPGSRVNSIPGAVATYFEGGNRIVI